MPYTTKNIYYPDINQPPDIANDWATTAESVDALFTTTKVHARRIGSTGLNNNWTLITWNSSDETGGTFWNSTTNASRIYLPKAGLWKIKAQVSFSLGISGTATLAASLQMNMGGVANPIPTGGVPGGTLLTTAQALAGAHRRHATMYAEVTTEDATQYLEMGAFQNTGGTQANGIYYNTDISLLESLKWETYLLAEYVKQ